MNRDIKYNRPPSSYGMGLTVTKIIASHAKEEDIGENRNTKQTWQDSIEDWSSVALMIIYKQLSSIQGNCVLLFLALSVSFVFTLSFAVC